MDKEKIINIVFELAIGLAVALFIIVVGFNLASHLEIRQCNQWAPENHCDALCYGKYGIQNNIGVINQPQDGYDYICICSNKGYISANKTCL